MSDPIIQVEGLGKSYLIGHEGPRERYTALRDVLARHARHLWGRSRQAMRGQSTIAGDEIEEFWALRDVSFEVQQGEVVGIIGRNGAGKSTLLKILSRITEPTEGRVTLRGRVASLLEVGTGFHPELTGRENIFLNGAILGMRRAEIRRKFDEIVAFAEVEKFLDTPVKRYSSGMYVRLAFAVAAHLEPEILVVDEVLAVGDAEFQKKCLGKMKDVSRGGRTVLFVSHNMAAVETLCSRAIVLRSGHVVDNTDARAAARQYNLLCLSKSPDDRSAVRKVSETLEIAELSFDPVPVPARTACTFRTILRSSIPSHISDFSLLVYSPLGLRVAILDLRTTGGSCSVLPNKALTIEGTIKDVPLVEGEYDVGIYLNCSAFRGNVYSLATLVVTSPAHPREIVPYAAHDRGFIDLDYDFRFLD
ncbi:MAG TPA: ABC transporter ATP-binding protein [Lacipirellulaceae bacterium]|nr:ABC transporter ATP-binding protein [Lacipirellulaceae bacterium]